MGGIANASPKSEVSFLRVDWSPIFPSIHSKAVHYPFSVHTVSLPSRIQSCILSSNHDAVFPGAFCRSPAIRALALVLLLAICSGSYCDCRRRKRTATSRGTFDNWKHAQGSCRYGTYYCRARGRAWIGLDTWYVWEFLMWQRHKITFNMVIIIIDANIHITFLTLLQSLSLVPFSQETAHKSVN